MSASTWGAGDNTIVIAATGDTTFNKAVAMAITEVNANTTLNTDHHTVLVNTNSADRVITLPAASGSTGRVYVVKKIDAAANSVTVDANGAETIDGAANTVLSSQWDYVTVQCDGSAWYII